MINNDAISRTAAIEAIRKNPDKSAEEIISEMPAMNNTAEWIPNTNSGWNCSHCEKYSSTLDQFCSKCGFKMTEQVIQKKKYLIKIKKKDKNKEKDKEKDKAKDKAKAS